MLYSEWLQFLHPRTRDYYYSAVLRRYCNEPKYIVFIDPRYKRSDSGGEVFNWLEEQAPDCWFDVGLAGAENYSILGFYDENLAMMFKLSYGNGYDPFNDSNAP